MLLIKYSESHLSPRKFSWLYIPRNTDPSSASTNARTPTALTWEREEREGDEGGEGDEGDEGDEGGSGERDIRQASWRCCVYSGDYSQHGVCVCVCIYVWSAAQSQVGLRVDE